MHIFGEIPFIKPQTTLKQQINGQKRWKMKEKDWSCFGWVFTACSVPGGLLSLMRFLKEISVPADTMLGGQSFLPFYSCCCCFTVTSSIPPLSTFRLFLFVFAPFLPLVSPWYNHTGWLGVKRQFTYLLTSLSCLFVCLWFCLHLLCSALWSSVWVSSSVIVVFCYLNSMYYSFLLFPQMFQFWWQLDYIK